MTSEDSERSITSKYRILMPMNANCGGWYYLYDQTCRDVHVMDAGHQDVWSALHFALRPKFSQKQRALTTALQKQSIDEWVSWSAYHADVQQAVIPPASVRRQRTFVGSDKTFHGHRQGSKSAREPWTSTCTCC